MGVIKNSSSISNLKSEIKRSVASQISNLKSEIKRSVESQISNLKSSAAWQPFLHSCICRRKAADLSVIFTMAATGVLVWDALERRWSLRKAILR